MKKLGAVFLVVAALTASSSFAGSDFKNGYPREDGASASTRSAANPNVTAGESLTSKWNSNPIRGMENTKSPFGGNLSFDIFCSSRR